MNANSDSRSGQPALPLKSATAARETNFLRMFNFSSYMTSAIIVSFFPLYFMDEGYTASQIGILYSTGPLISIFANLLLGIVSDKYRTIKKLLTLLLIGQLIMVSLLFTTDSFIIICFIMLAFYFFQTPINPLSDSLILLSSQYTGTPYALVRIFGSLGFAFSALAVGQLLRGTGSSMTPVICLISIGIAIVLSFTLKDYQGALRKMEFSGFFKLLRKPQIVSFFVLVLIISISHRMYESFLAVSLRQLGSSDSFVGVAWLTSAISEIPIFYLLGKYGHKFKELPMLAIASLMYAVRLLLMSLITEPIWAIPIQAMHSITFGIYFITALRYISTIIPDEYRASGQAVYAVVFVGFSGLISGLVGGSVYEHFGKATFFQLAMLLALTASAGFLAKHFMSRSNG
ncbi:MFS transporter [Paenibacillus oenotherae]|uniref:MFS transporter n=1 Tax=Paenibacillus oenotherae TaxID=1435645 RepID=A0ABS7D982_9BACL|nr:MFS transporter [Paenibacillus oenotherae]MBW7476121.1 MFS transporter [Paenibacillus oenotherae]